MVSGLATYECLTIHSEPTLDRAWHPGRFAQLDVAMNVNGVNVLGLPGSVDGRRLECISDPRELEFVESFLIPEKVEDGFRFASCANAPNQWRQSSALYQHSRSRCLLYSSDRDLALKRSSTQKRLPNSLTAALRRFQTPSAVIVGAGISYPYPSNVATASFFINTLLRVLPLSTRDRKELRAATSPNWQRGIGYDDFLRFEHVMAAVQNTIDPNLSLATRIIEDSTPNIYHYKVASLIGLGHLVFTTNFDSLIEDAARRLAIRCSPVVSDRDYSLYRRRPESFPNPLFKLHGSLLGRQDRSQPIAATFQAVVDETTVNPTKWNVVNSLLQGRSLVVVGYSGSDDFDVMPTISQGGGPGCQLLWIQHSPDRRFLFYDIDTLERTSAVPWAKVGWFLGRLFGDLGHRPSLKWETSHVALCVGPTSSILDALVGSHCDSFTIEKPRLSRVKRSKRISSEIKLKLSNSAFKAMVLSGLLFHRAGLFDASIRYLQAARTRMRVAASGSSGAHLFAALSDIYWQRGDVQHCAWATESLVVQILQCQPLSTVETIEFSRVLSQACLFNGTGNASRLPHFPTAARKSSGVSRISCLFEFDFRTNLLRQSLEEGLQLPSPPSNGSGDSSFLKRPGITKEQVGELNTLARLVNSRPEREAVAHFDYIRALLDVAHRRALSISGKSMDADENKVDDIQFAVVRNSYAQLGRYRRWADTLFLHAQSYSLGGWLDWAYGVGGDALMIYEKIGNTQAKEATTLFLKDLETRPGASEGIDEVGPLCVILKRAARYVFK